MNLGFKRFAIGLIVASILLFVSCDFDGSSVSQTNSHNMQSIVEPIPWENGGKQPAEYSWAEFEELNISQQIAFQNSFSSIDAFDAWLQNAQRVEINAPWENGGKQPAEYTWEEFECLTAEQQIAFQNSFDNSGGFDTWLQTAQTPNIDLPWENGGKEPEAYSWEEFETLTSEQQMAFQSYFEDIDAFDSWLENALYGDLDEAWDGEEPENYTWEEFEKLSKEEQMAFQNSFENIEAFDAWLQKAQRDNLNLPWENGGKPPVDYTWEEYENLSPELQMIFQNSFGSFEAFDAWMQRVNP